MKSELQNQVVVSDTFVLYHGSHHTEHVMVRPRGTHHSLLSFTHMYMNFPAGALRICLTDLFVFLFRFFLSSIFIGTLQRKQKNKTKPQSVEERATTRKRNNRKPSMRKVGRIGWKTEYSGKTCQEQNSHIVQLR